MKSTLNTILFAALIAVPIASSAWAEAPVAAEVSPPGDIPDNQAFVMFTSPTGYAVKIPEGWSRKDDGTKTTFSDKYNHVALQLTDVPHAIDEAYAKASLVPDIQTSGRAVDGLSVKTLKLKSGPVIAIEYASNSEPNAVTNKQVREENERIYFVKDKQMMMMTLSAPVGADNVDQWLFMANSFRWK
ncbi:MAG: hypothetical protein KGO53_09575 [Alphaproteobacteria bacterium]|nr:hypothetical protein [Alphaproteobacteria bacterium]